MLSKKILPACLLVLMTACSFEDGDSLYAQGQTAFTDGNYQQAISHFEKALDKSTIENSKSDVLTSIGNVYLELDQTEQAISFLEQAIDEDIANYKAYFNLGIAYELIGDVGLADEMYQTALKLKPDDAAMNTYLGAKAMERGNYDAAIEHMVQALLVDNSLAITHANLALVYSQVGRFEEAQNEAEQARQLGYEDMAKLDQLMASIQQRKIVNSEQDQALQEEPVTDTK